MTEFVLKYTYNLTSFSNIPSIVVKQSVFMSVTYVLTYRIRLLSTRMHGFQAGRRESYSHRDQNRGNRKLIPSLRISQEYPRGKNKFVEFLPVNHVE